MKSKEKQSSLKNKSIYTVALSFFVIFAYMMIVCVKFNHVGKAYAADFAVHGASAANVNNTKTLLADEDDGGDAECEGDDAEEEDTCDGGDGGDNADEGDNNDDGGDDAEEADDNDDEESCDVEAEADDDDAMNTTASHVLGANIVTIPGHVKRDKQTGLFSNPSFNLNNLPAGRYKLVLHVHGYLTRQLVTASGASIRIGAGQKTIAINPTALISGDIAPLPNGNNLIDIEDYNAVYPCLGMQASAAPTQSCLDPKRADIDKNGVVNEADLSIIQGNFAKSGASLSNPATLVTPMNNYRCSDDPTCDQTTKTLQLCPLKCEIIN